VVLKVGGIAPLGRFLGASRRKKNKGVNRGEKQHKGGRNAQPLIDY